MVEHDADLGPAPRGSGVIRSQVVLLAATAGRLLLTLSVTVFLGRVLAPSDFGFFALVSTVLVVGTELLDLGTSSVAAREIARSPARERALLEALMGWRCLCGAILGGAVAAIALMHDDPGRRWVLLGAAAVLPAMAPGALYPAFQVRQAQAGPALLSVGGQALLLIGSMCLAAFRVAGALFAWLLVLREAMSALGFWMLGTRLLGFRPRPAVRGRGLGTFMRGAALYGLAVLMHSLYFHCDVFFVRALRGEEELGAYASAFRLIYPLLGLPWILMIPLLPVLSRTAGGQRTSFATQVGGAAGLLLGIGATGAVAGAVLAPDLIFLLYGGHYFDGDLSSVNAFRWLSVALGFAFVPPAFATALLADGRERALFMLGLCCLLFNIAGNLLLLPRYGFVAAAVMTALTELVACAGALLLFARAVGRNPVGARWLGFLLPAAIVGALLLWPVGSPIVRVLCGIGLGAAAVLVLLGSPAARRHREAVTVRDEGAP